MSNEEAGARRERSPFLAVVDRHFRAFRRRQDDLVPADPGAPSGNGPRRHLHHAPAPRPAKSTGAIIISSTPPPFPSAWPPAASWNTPRSTTIATAFPKPKSWTSSAQGQRRPAQRRRAGRGHGLRPRRAGRRIGPRACHGFPDAGQPGGIGGALETARHRFPGRIGTSA